MNTTTIPNYMVVVVVGVGGGWGLALWTIHENNEFVSGSCITKNEWFQKLLDPMVLEINLRYTI